MQKVSKSTLYGFLKDDVTNLIKAIRDNDDLAATETPGAGYETLEDFANYWEIHIENIQPNKDIQTP